MQIVTMVKKLAEAGRAITRRPHSKVVFGSPAAARLAERGWCCSCAHIHMIFGCDAAAKHVQRHRPFHSPQGKRPDTLMFSSRIGICLIRAGLRISLAIM